MGRPTLYFDPSCGKSVSDAIDTLNKLKDAQDSADTNINHAVWITTVCLGGALAIYQVVNMICYSKRYCRQECCCHSPCCFRANKIIYAAINHLAGLSVLVLASLAFGSNYDKYEGLN